MYEVAVCDDVPLDRKLLIKEIGRIKKYNSDLRFHEYNYGINLLADMEYIRFSIIFLDIQLEGIDGEQTAEEIRKRDDSVVLVFYTGYAEPTPHSIEVQPYRFIKKNMAEKDRLKYIEDSLEKMISVSEMPGLVAKVDGAKIVLRPDDIVYIEKYKKTVKVHISKNAMQKFHIAQDMDSMPEIRISDKLETLYHMLQPYGFGYPHDSYIINFKYMVFCSENEIKLEGFPDMVFRVTRSKALEFNKQKRGFFTSKYRGK